MGSIKNEVLLVDVVVDDAVVGVVVIVEICVKDENVVVGDSGGDTFWAKFNSS